MATNKMLIDATHPEETRVVVLRNGRVEEFDYESAARKLLRGNIYLAKVTRVEPSLQAAFIDYGGNRHGFLAFNEIHPDYYQIPVADRQALLDEEAAIEAEEEAAADARAERLARRRRRDGDRGQGSRAQSHDRDHDRDHDLDNGSHGAAGSHDEDHDEGDTHGDEPGESEASSMPLSAGGADDVISEELPEPEVAGGFEPSSDEDRDDDGYQDGGKAETADGGMHAHDDHTHHDHGHDDHRHDDHGHEDHAHDDHSHDDHSHDSSSENGEGGVQVVAAATADAEQVEVSGAEDALEELPSRPRRRPRSYKIQEVIKRRQVILVQVVKEERGNKGAALTTYLSLAGRYTVLMPNTARGGGISRKITNPQDRKRLKAIAQELEVPEGMGLIIRTAGAARTKQEIKRDFEYLLRLWESVRELTLESTAPSLVYEEGNLIKRSIRDLYNKDVEEIVVAGDHAHKDARDFMRMLMPSHAKNVVLHQDPEPLFNKYGIERQLNAMFSPYVTLKSGGYLVINQTEALVAIDVNSGKATREFSIEETAYNTNLEASDEIARQLKLRDLAGLIVIDFIDMEEKRNNRSVERRLKDALRFDRARIQLGRISHFGLMEMSRQRLRTGVLEGSTSQCPHCQGTGIIRSTESVALAVLRGLEDALMAGVRSSSLVATTTSTVALYILNNKRHFINEMEARHGIFIAVQASDKLQGANFLIEKGTAAPVAHRRPDRAAVNMDWGFDGESLEGSEPPEDVSDGEGEIIEVGGSDGPSEGRRSEGRSEGRSSEEGGQGDRSRRRRRRRGRRGNNGERGGEPRFDDRGGHGSDQGRGDVRADGGDDADSGAGDDAEGDEGADDFQADGNGGNDEARTSSAEGGDARQGGREDGAGRRRRRGRRGGRRGRDRNGRPQVGEDGLGPQPSVGVDQDDYLAADGEGRAIAPVGGESSIDAEPQVMKPAAPIFDRRVEPAVAPVKAEVRPVEVPQSSEARPKIDVTETTSETPRPRARSTSSGEPKLERVVVGPDAAAAADVDAAAAGPTRKGWWQRRLGG